MCEISRADTSSRSIFLRSGLINNVSLCLFCSLSQELYMQNNSIRKLPNELGDLTNLTILNVSSNKLKQLPDSIGMLERLTVLDISRNKAIQKLPKTLGKAQMLVELNVEGLNILYPPEDVLCGGTIVIVAFLANECGIDYSPEKSLSARENLDDVNNGRGDDSATTISRDKESDVQVYSQLNWCPFARLYTNSKTLRLDV